MRASTKIGDVFSVGIDNNSKKYFQYVANDLTQLNSDVIRAFKKVYPINAKHELSEIVSGEVEFFAHCVTKLGLKMKFWEKVGNIVLVSWDQLSDFSATSIISTAGVVPAAFRPTQNFYSVVNASISRVVQIQVSSAGTVYLYFRDYTGSLIATNVASAGGVAYRTA